MKIGKIALLSLFVFMVTAAPIVSVLATPTTPPATIITGNIFTVVAGWVEDLRDWFFVLMLAIIVLFFLLAAYHFITAGGSEEKVNKGRDMVKWGLVGVAVVLLAGGVYALVSTVLSNGVGT